MKRLDKLYLKVSRIDKLEKTMKLFKIEKRSEETMKEYILRYEKYSRECEKSGGGRMSEEMKGSHLLSQANLSKTDLHVILGACGNEEYNFGNIKTGLLDRKSVV